MDVGQRVINKIAEVANMMVAEVTPEKRLIKDLGMESLDFVDLACDLENEFKIPEIDQREWTREATVATVVADLERRVKENEKYGPEYRQSTRAAVPPEGTS